MSVTLTKKIIPRVLVSCTGFLVAIVLAELGLRFYESSTNKYVWKPHLERTFLPAKGVMPGIDGPNRFIINSQGIRGDEFSNRFEEHWLAVGGSTTEGLYLDENEAWPYLLQQMLNQKGRSVWVGNIGKSGARLENHIPDAKKVVKRSPSIDKVLVLVGVNEVVDALRMTLADSDEMKYEREHNVDYLPLYKKTLLWQRLGVLKRRFFTKTTEFEKSNLVQDQAGKMYERWRKNRAASSVVDRIPSLDQALLKYDRQLKQFVKEMSKLDVEVIFITQPTMWKRDLSEYQHSLTWLGWGGVDQNRSSKYYSIKVLEVAMKKFNERLLSVCEKGGLNCVDLAKHIPKDVTSFYDDCHFNESGARKVAEHLSGELSSM